MLDFGAGFLVGFFVSAIMWGISISIADYIADRRNRK